MIAETSANFDASKQKNDVESVMAMKPDLISGYPVDPNTGAEVFKPVVEAGIPLVIVSNRPQGYNPGKEYVGISTNNPYDNGLNVMVQAVKDCINRRDIKGLFTDLTWNVGMNSAIMAAYGLLGKKAPEMVVVPNAPVSPDNLRQIWNIAYTGSG